MVALPAMLASGGTRAASRIELVHVGARECPYCTVWRRRDLPALKASPMFARMSFTEIEPRRIRDACIPRSWPQRLQPILQSLPLPDGTPRFLILRDGVLYASFLGDWQHAVAELRRLTGST